MAAMDRVAFRSHRPPAGRASDLTGLAIISANGTGGNGTIAGTGGDGLGGTAGLYAGIDDNPDSPLVGGTVTAVNANVTSYGRGDPAGGRRRRKAALRKSASRYGSLTVTGTLFGDAGGRRRRQPRRGRRHRHRRTFQVMANFFGDTGLSTTDLGTADLWAVGVGGNGGGSGNAGGDRIWRPGPGESRRRPARPLRATALSLHAGANGGVGGNGAVGGRGGDANGGHALIDISAGTANLGVVQQLRARRSRQWRRRIERRWRGRRRRLRRHRRAQRSRKPERHVLPGRRAGKRRQRRSGHHHAGRRRPGRGRQHLFQRYSGGSVDFTGAMVLDASGHGGTGSSLGNSFGGFAQFLANVSTIDAGDITLAATGNFGGVAELSLFGPELTANSLTLNVNGVASAGTASLGVGTDPFEGVGSVLTLNAFTANANGGANGDIFVSVDDGSSADLGVAQPVGARAGRRQRNPRDRHHYRRNAAPAVGGIGTLASTTSC